MSDPRSPASSGVQVSHFVSRLRREDGGIVRFVLDASTLMAAAGHEITVFVRDATGSEAAAASLTAAGVRVVVVDGQRVAVGRLGAVARAATGSVLHLHGVWDPSVAQLARLAENLSVPIVLSTHGALDRWSMSKGTLKKRLYLETVGRTVFRRVCRVHCTSEAEQDQVAEVLPRGTAPSFFNAPYLFDYRTFEPSESQRPSSPGRLLFLSRLHPKKRPSVAIRAMAALARRGHDLELSICGGARDEPGASGNEASYARSLPELAATLGIDDRVVFHGHLDDPERSALLGSASVMILPTLSENFGLVIVEALALGVPVVTTTGTDIHREIARCPAVRVVQNERDETLLADVIASAAEELLAQEPVRLAAAARRFVEDWLDIEQVVAAYASVYRSCVAGDQSS